MRRYNNAVLDAFGNPVAGATITATDAETGETVSMYDNREGTGPSRSFVLTDTRGMFGFYARNRRANIKATYGNVVSVIPDEMIYDPEDNALDLSKYVRRELELLPDECSPTTIYRGSAPVGSDVSDSVWTIDRLTLVSGAVVRVERSKPRGGVSWNDRASAVYE